MNRTTLSAAILAAAIGSATAVAQSPTLLKNFSTTPVANPYSGSTTNWAQVGAKGYIAFITEEHGTELWTYDVNTRSLAQMTENLFPGASKTVGACSDQTAFNGEVYFTAWTVDTGRELYKTDGTVAGTSLVKDIMPGNPEGSPGPGPKDLKVYGGYLLFTADNGTDGREMWKTDGTTAGTVMVDPTVGDPADGVAQYGVTYAETLGRLFFSSDGHLFTLTLGPDTITDIDSVNYEGISGLSDDAVIGTDLYFGAKSTDPLDTIGQELYKSDGTSITLAVDILPTANTDSAPRYFKVFNNRLYFQAKRDAVSYYSDYELFEYYYDTGTSAWVLTDLDINQQPHYSGLVNNSSYAQPMAVNNNTLFVYANDGINGGELWTIGTLGITAATMIDIRPGSLGAVSAYSMYMTVANSQKVIFVANDGVHGNEIWESDGTAAGTILGGDHAPGTQGINQAKIFPAMGAGLCLFRGDNYNGWNTELHSYQASLTVGTAGTLTAEVDVNPQAGRDGNGAFNNAKGVVDAGYGVGMFSAVAYDTLGASLGTELWRTDGTPAGTVFVKDIRTGSSSSSPQNFCQAGTLMYFSADDGTVGTELYFSNGVPEGQPGHAFGLAADVKPGGTWDSGSPSYITYAGNSKVVFAASDGTIGNGYTSQLFWSNGASFGPIIHYVVEGGLTIPTPVYQPRELVYHNGLVYMGAEPKLITGERHGEIFSTNGSTATKLTDMDFSSWPRIIHFDDANQQVYFVASYGSTLPPQAPAGTLAGEHLWVVDSAFATTPVRLTNEFNADPYGYSQGSGASSFADLNGTLFFSAFSDLAGEELWTTDGTAAGTGVFMDINPGTASANTGTPHVIDAGLVFVADDGVHGSEMWLSDGTVGGTAIIADTTPGTYPQGYGAPEYLVQVGSRRIAYRYGQNSEYGSETWTCDGTAPVRISDINALNGDSEPYNWQLQNGLLVFKANEWQIGTEAYTIDFGANTKSFGITTAPPSHTQHASISCNDPVLGAPFQIKGTGALASSTCGLAVSFLSGEVVFQGLSIYVDLGTFQIAGFTTADANGNFAFPAVTYPNNPNYAGADLVYQAASLNPLGLFKSRLTNALYMNVSPN